MLGVFFQPRIDVTSDAQDEDAVFLGNFDGAMAHQPSSAAAEFRRKQLVFLPNGFRGVENPNFVRDSAAGRIPPDHHQLRAGDRRESLMAQTRRKSGAVDLRPF